MKKWTLSQKVTAIIVLQIAVLLAMQVAVQWQVILPTFKRIEVEQASNAMNRIKDRFWLELDYLNRFVYEYSDWEDSYDFIDSKDQDYIDENLYEGLVSHLGGNVMIYITQDFELVWGIEEIEVTDGFYTNDSEDFLNAIVGQLKPSIEEIDQTEDINNQFAKGFSLLNELPVMFAVRPIVSSEFADSNGYIILVKYIDQQLISLYEEQLSSRFVLEPVDSSVLNASKELPILQLAMVNSTSLSVSGSIYTNDVPIFKITTEVFRDITLNGLNSIYLASTILLIIGLVSVAFIWKYVSFQIFKPLEDLSSQMQGISWSKDASQQYLVDREDEIGLLAKSFNLMITNINSHQHELKQAQTMLKETNDKLSDLVRRDSLTGIANRLAFEEVIETNWSKFARLKLPISIMMLDIDYFKDYNDLYGHLQGDECLKQVAQVLSSCLNRSNDFLARYGGEEFIVTLLGLSDLEAKNVANTILDNLRQVNIIHEKSKIASHVTLSIGVASMIPKSHIDPKVLIEKADQALYKAKAAGRNQIVIYEPH